MDAYTAACTWVERGFSLIPIQYRGKSPAFDGLKLVHPQRESTWGQFTRRMPTPAELKIWFTGPKRNLGIITGWRGLTVLDFDSREMYAAWQGWAAGVGGIAGAVSASTYRVLSARGVHVYVLVGEEVASYQVPGVDVKGRWGCVLVPPSVHPSGHLYADTPAEIMSCERLADVFPLVRPRAVSASALAPITDPLEVADHAVDCGGPGAVAKIRQRLSLEQLLGVSVGGRRWVKTRCPLHQDTDPSLVVYRDGHCRCLAGCNGGRQMDVIDLYAAIRHISLREAIVELGHWKAGDRQ